ncbi:MAG: TonB-dependent receptor [Steroidobacteraceae bacterium]
MNKGKQSLVLGAMSCAIFINPYTVASAQTDSGESTALEEIIVTAEKREVDLQKTAISIQVYSGEDLKKQGKKRIDEIMNGVVGVQAQDSQVGQSFSMRGVETGAGPGGPGQNSGTTVAVLIDGIYQSRTETVRGGTLDVGQVEVMRGTQSTTLGANALAGAVSLVSNKPVFEYQASGGIEVGNYNLLNMEGVLNVPLTSNQALRVAYSSNKRDGYISSGAGDSDLKNARLKYRWQASDDLDIVGTISHQDIGGNGVTQGTLTASGTWEAYNPARQSGSGTCGGAGQPTCYTAILGYPALFGLAPGPSFRDRANPWNDGYPKDVWPNNPSNVTKITSYSADINWNTGIGTVTVLPSYEHARFVSTQAPRGTGTNFMAQDRTQITKQIDVRLASSEEGKLQWLAGAYYYNTFYSGPFTTILYPNDGMYASTAACAAAVTGMSNCYMWTRDNESSTVTTSVYGNANFSITDELRVIGGLRYSRDKKVIETTLAQAAGTVTGPTTPYVYTRFPEASWTATSFRAGIEYDLLPKSMVYATLASGYQPGVVNAMTGAASSKNTSTQFTAGIKNRFLDNTLQFNVEAFLLKYKDRPFTYNVVVGSCTTPAGFTGTLYVPANYACITPVGATVTVPKQESRGVDIEVNYLPTAADRIDLTFEWLEATFGTAPAAPTYSVTDITNAAVSQGGVINTTAAQQILTQYNEYIAAYKGVTLQNAPKISANLTYEHRFTLPGGSTLSPSVNVFHKSKYWGQGNSPAPSGITVNPQAALADGSILRQDDYQLWNAFLSWRASDSRFSATAYVKNIKDEAIQLNIGGEGANTPNYVSLDAPRTFGVTFNANF